MYTFNSIRLSVPGTKVDTTIDNTIKKTYNFKTNETYRMKRLMQLDVFNDEKILDNECFKYDKIWDPYTGLIIDEHDEFGPLCFNGYELGYFYYKNRLNGLWNEPSDGFDGYYGDLLGTGKNINIISRGPHPERYLLRLPLIDCYVPENSTHSHITMGPLLSDDELDSLDKILEYNYNTFNKSLSTKPHLMNQIKHHYDEALNPSPSPTDDLIIDFKIST